MVTKTLSIINEQEQLASRLSSQLNHEKQVLQDKIESATSILNQIGENTLIVQSQMKTIHTQINDIKQLKRVRSAFTCYLYLFSHSVGARI